MTDKVTQVVVRERITLQVVVNTCSWARFVEQVLFKSALPITERIHASVKGGRCSQFNSNYHCGWLL